MSTQLSLILPAPEPAAAETTAGRRRGRIIRAAAQRAEDDAAGWNANALAALRAYLQQHRAPFLFEEFRTWAAACVGKPADARAWGYVTRRAVELHLMEQVGTRVSKVNYCPKPLWQKAGAR